MINYIIQIFLFQVLFLVVYDLFLSKETFFIKNRWYLMGTAVLSFLIPLLKIPMFQKVVPQELTILLPEIVLSPQTIIEKISFYQSINYGEILFSLGCLVFFVLFLIKLIRILSLINKHCVEQKLNYRLVWLPKQTKAFSFFNFIFLGKEIPEYQQEKIIQHELVHSKQHHSVDLLFFEFLKILMWFNPMVWLYQKRITLVHEYISDEVVTKSTGKENYINTILSDFFEVENIVFVNQFYKHSLIKKRIIMMTKEKSNQVKQLKYLLLVPVLASMLFYVSCTNEEREDTVIISKEERIKELEAEIQLLKNNSFNQNKEIFEGEKDYISFSILDKAPTFPGCNEGNKDCFNEKMREFVQQNFNVELANSLGLSSGKKRVFIQFKISKEGKIIDIKAKAPHPKLDEEAIRIVSILPIMQAGEKDGQKVKTVYTLPIIFNIQ